MHTGTRAYDLSEVCRRDRCSQGLQRIFGGVFDINAAIYLTQAFP